MLRDRLAAGRRVLAPLTQVRILVPQPFRRVQGYPFGFLTVTFLSEKFPYFFAQTDHLRVKPIDISQIV